MGNGEKRFGTGSAPGILLAFFVYSNFFIAFCAVLMTHQSFHFLLVRPADNYLLGFVFFSTICSYSFHWYLTGQSVIPSPRIEWLRRYRYIHAILFIVGLAGSVYYFFYIRAYWPWLLVAVAATFLYSAPKIPHPYFRALRKVALGKTIFLAFVWMYVTTVLPIITSGVEWTTPFTLFVISRFFLIYAICILFDYRDREDDRSAGIKSLITYMSEKGIAYLFIFSLLVFGLSTLLLLPYGYEPLHIFFILLPGIITGALYTYSHKHYSDIFWYLVMDGLMAVSALLTMVAGV